MTRVFFFFYPTRKLQVSTPSSTLGTSKVRSLDKPYTHCRTLSSITETMGTQTLPVLTTYNVSKTMNGSATGNWCALKPKQ